MPSIAAELTVDPASKERPQPAAPPDGTRDLMQLPAAEPGLRNGTARGRDDNLAPDGRASEHGPAMDSDSPAATTTPQRKTTGVVNRVSSAVHHPLVSCPGRAGHKVRGALGLL